MTEKLNILITLLEEEKQHLLQFIQVAVNEEEYLIANAHSNALRLVNQKLLTLRNIDDIHYDEKYFLSGQIDFDEHQLNKETPDSMIALRQELEKKKEKLARLNLKRKETNALGNGGIFDETLSRLLQRKIKKFTLILSKRNHLQLEFSVLKNILNLTFPNIKKRLKEYVLYQSQIDHMILLGFSLTNHDDKLVLKFSMKDMSSLNDLKIILSKIVFEVFYFKEFENESFIEINK